MPPIFRCIFWFQTVLILSVIYHQNYKQKLNQTVMKSLFYMVLKLLNRANLFMLYSAYSIWKCLTLWSNLRYRKLLPTYTTFHQSRKIMLLFLHLVTYPNPTLLLDKSSSIFFLHTFYFLFLLNQATSLTWLIVSGSQSTKLSSSRLTLLKFILLRSISLIKNVTISESVSSKIIPSLGKTAWFSFSIALLVANQSGTNFNASR